MIGVLLFAFTLFALPVPVPAPNGAAIVPPDLAPVSQSPAQTQTSAPANVTVNVTPPPPDPAATQSMYDHFVANAEYDHANVPVSVADSLLKGANIWTTTPTSMTIDIDVAQKIRGTARNISLVLFMLGILYCGLQLAFGTMVGHANYQQVLPMLLIGFLLAWFSEDLARRSIALCNWLNQQIGDPSLTDFSGTALTLPDRPDPTDVPGVIGVPLAFFSGMFTSLLYAIVLIILEVKLIFRDAILVVTSTVMPISGALWAFQITRGWGVTLYRLFFGWLFGQPLVVVCLAIAGSLVTLFNVDGAALTFVKVAVLFMAIKAVSIFASGGLGGGGFFGLASLLMVMRRATGIARGLRGSGPTGSAAIEQPANSAAVQGAHYNGTGNGTAATSRPWRPSMSTA